MATGAVAGFQMLTVSTAAVGLTVPASGAPTYALIQCESNPVRWRDDGTDPTATVGNLMAVGGSLRYDGPLARIKFIRQGGADGTISVSYYSL